MLWLPLVSLTVGVAVELMPRLMLGCDVLVGMPPVCWSVGGVGVCSARSFDDEHALHVVLPVAWERAEEEVAAWFEGHECGAGLPGVDLPRSA
jgi:hypothetical protein